MEILEKAINFVGWLKNEFDSREVNLKEEFDKQGWVYGSMGMTNIANDLGNHIYLKNNNDFFRFDAPETTDFISAHYISNPFNSVAPSFCSQMIALLRENHAKFELDEATQHLVIEDWENLMRS